MFCNQCEQTAQGTGCEKIGVCGKTEDVSALQDLLTHALQGLAIVALEARNLGIVDNGIDRFSAQATFSCLTNVDFDPARFDGWIRETVQLRNDLKARVEAAGGSVTNDAAALSFIPAPDLAGLEAQGAALNFISSLDENEDLRSLKQIALYGLRGLAAYVDHAAILGQQDDEVFAFIHEILATLTRKDLGVDDLVAGDVFLICSDGLSDLVQDDEIQETLLTRSLEQVCGDLVRLALRRGGNDNVTIIAAEVTEAAMHRQAA